MLHVRCALIAGILLGNLFATPQVFAQSGDNVVYADTTKTSQNMMVKRGSIVRFTGESMTKSYAARVQLRKGRTVLVDAPANEAWQLQWTSRLEQSDLINFTVVLVQPGKPEMLVTKCSVTLFEKSPIKIVSPTADQSFTETAEVKFDLPLDFSVRSYQVLVDDKPVKTLAVKGRECTAELYGLHSGKHSLTVEAEIDEGVGKVITEPVVFTMEPSVFLETDNLPKSFDLRVSKTLPPVLYPIRLRDGLQIKSVGVSIDNTLTDCLINTEDGQAWKFNPSQTEAGSHDVSIIVTTTSGKTFASDVKTIEVVRDLRSDFYQWWLAWEAKRVERTNIMKQGRSLDKSVNQTPESIEARRLLLVRFIKLVDDLPNLEVPQFLSKDNSSILRKAVKSHTLAMKCYVISAGHSLDADKLFVPYGGSILTLRESGLSKDQQDALVDQASAHLKQSISALGDASRLQDEGNDYISEVAKRLNVSLISPRK